jgi:hypothetical protein
LVGTGNEKSDRVHRREYDVREDVDKLRRQPPSSAIAPRAALMSPSARRSSKARQPLREHWVRLDTSVS